MTMAGFTAEASLYTSARHYRRAAMMPANSAGANRIVQQLKSCGSCSPLTWPNGTNTGACARACCQPRQVCTPGGGCRTETVCSTETCQCEGAGGLGSWGWVLTF
jgi:hypothetical protein